jgi:UDP-N-acetylmuramoyl-tripeptide--D-alanyl-D-alanine ligase
VAAVVARLIGVPLPDALQVEFSRLREEERPLPGGGLLLNDCYNANPVSMRAALEHLVERGQGHRRVAVLGEMAELGSEAPAYHREIGELVHRLGIEQVIGVGELARAYGGDWVPSAADAAATLTEALRPGDVVLVKGSRSVGLETVAEKLTA